MTAVLKRLIGKPAPVGDFQVLRVIPQHEHRFVGPFCFLDHMGPHTQHGHPKGGVGPHPHIGLATVTYLFEGEALHRDTLGTEQLIRPGEVNWMQAGRGIAHSERPPAHLFEKTQTMHGLQFWVGLPTSHEESAPSFQHASLEQLPTVGPVRVVLGEWAGQRSPIALASPTFLATAQLPPGAELEIPAQYPERAVYVVEGSLTIEGEVFEQNHLAVLDAPDQSVWVSTDSGARIAIFGGAPLDGPRYLLWNFVSSRKERLEQAAKDWKARRFALIPGDSEDRIPMPGE